MASETIQQVNRKVIYVFPDYTSTGLWIQPSGSNIESARVGVSLGLRIALKYWHNYWESVITETDPKDTWIKAATAKWVVDGYELARLMSNENEEYEFKFKE